jgi:hypothetical protein
MRVVQRDMLEWKLELKCPQTFQNSQKKNAMPHFLAVKYKSDPIMKVKIDLIRFLKRRQYI